ncbi:MAG TPA: S9 family peptidase [Steroidobacteraceae bacterium]|nr:S9 family peptidase [Steroidobacteraceae bacterium]
MRFFPFTAANAAMAALATLSGGPAAAATPFELADFYRLATVAEPAFSPDGERIAYTVSRNDKDDDQATTDLWTVPWNGGKATPLLRTPDTSEWQPRYSRDGKAVYFLSDAARDETTQLWVLKGGRARQVTSVVGGIADFDLSPDGKRAVVVAEVGLHVGPVEDDDVPPPIETERFLFKRDGEGYLDDRTRQLFIVDLASGKARQLTYGQRDHWQPAWSPDGASLAYTAKERGDTDRDTNYEVFVQPVDGGEPRRISVSPGPDNDPDWGARPSWSPDSRRVSWLEGGESKWIYYATAQLAIADLASGAITRPARIDRWFYYPKFAPDGSVVALVEQDRDTWLARIDPASGRVDYLSSGPRFGSDFAVAADGRLVMLESDVDAPAELFAVEGHRQLTRHNDWVADRARGEVRDVAFRSGDVEIHGYVTLPAGFDPARPAPLITYLHGGPVYQHSHEFDLVTRLYAAGGYAVLAVNPRGSSGRGFDFSRAIYADWGNLDVQDISAGITHVVDAHLADPRRIGVVGWSYGGILTDYMIASDARIKAAISGAGVANVLATWGVDMYAREYVYELGTPWENFETWKKLAYPFLHPERITAPTLFQCAGADDNVPCAGAQQMYLTLKTRGVPTRLIVYPGQNHGLSVPSYLVHRMRSNLEWFDRWLGVPRVIAQ